MSAPTNTDIHASLTSVAEFLSTPEGKAFYRASYADWEREWLSSTDYPSDARINARCDAFRDVQKKLGYNADFWWENVYRRDPLENKFTARIFARSGDSKAIANRLDNLFSITSRYPA